MKFQVQDKLLTIEDKYIEYSPFLRGLTQTSMNVPQVNGAFVIENIDPLEFLEYLKFLSGDATFEYIPELFEFMGHPNSFHYPDEYFKVKLYDDWVRDNAYRLKLFDDPYFGLIELPTDKILDDEGQSLFKQRAETVLKAIERKRTLEIPSYPLLGGGFYIAGGSVLYLLGLLDNFRDIDIFTTNKSKTIDYARELIKEFQYEKNRGYGILFEAGELHVSGQSFSFTDYHSWASIQFILRTYTCPSEIVHGFDVGSSCLITDGIKVWTTMRGMYSLATLTNWFDPSRSSPTYDTRLCKYHNRGFRIMLPMLDELSLNEKAYQDFKDAVLRYYYNNIQVDSSNEEGEEEEYLEDAFDPEIEDAIDEITKYTSLSSDQVYKYKTIHDHGNPIVNALIRIRDEFTSDKPNKRTKKRQDDFKKKIPSDPASLIILERLGYSYSLITLINGRYTNSDYEKGDSKELTQTEQLHFKEQSPMEQVSSTFYPEPITNPEALIDFYTSSPLISKEHSNVLLDDVKFIYRGPSNNIVINTGVLKAILEELHLI